MNEEWFVWFRSIMRSFETSSTVPGTVTWKFKWDKRTFRKERPLFYLRAFFSSHFQGRSLPQIPSGFPSPIQPKNDPVSQVPIPRNPEELVTTALTSILATGGSIPEGNRMESWFQKGDPSDSPSRPMVPTTDHISYEWRMRWQSIPTLSTVLYPWLLHYWLWDSGNWLLFVSWTRTSNIIVLWVVV